MHMDYAVSEATKTTNMTSIKKLALIYDVMCEYGVHLDERFLKYIGLSLPEGLDIIKAIGLFHVHGHIDECLHRYATTYIPNLGMIDGEILETLWSVINQTARSTRGATTAHRTEVLDDHMGDSNWKKTINMGSYYFSPFLTALQASTHHGQLASTVLKKYERAVREQRQISEYFAGITESCPKDLLPVWTRDIEHAEARRQADVKSMDYMNSTVKKRQYHRPSYFRV